MAQKTEIILVDDTDGSRAKETIQFALDGISYQIDLNEENASKLRESLRPWIEKARRVRRRRGVRKAPSDTALIRQWAIDNKFDINKRGRISQEILRAYEQAH